MASCPKKVGEQSQTPGHRQRKGVLNEARLNLFDQLIGQQTKQACRGSMGPGFRGRAIAAPTAHDSPDALPGEPAEANRNGEESG